MDRKPFRILAVAGSLRQGSYNRGLLRAAEEVAEGPETDDRYPCNHDRRCDE